VAKFGALELFLRWFHGGPCFTGAEQKQVHAVQGRRHGATGAGNSIWIRARLPAPSDTRPSISHYSRTRSSPPTVVKFQLLPCPLVQASSSTRATLPPAIQMAKKKSKLYEIGEPRKF